MWPTLTVGTIYRILVRGRGKARAAMLLRVGPSGELWLAIPPQSSRRKWTALGLDRADVKGVWTDPC